MKPNAQLVADSLRLWESFRQRDCQKERRMALIDQMLKLCKGKVMDVRCSHIFDTIPHFDSGPDHLGPWGAHFAHIPL